METWTPFQFWGGLALLLAGWVITVVHGVKKAKRDPEESRFEAKATDPKSQAHRFNDCHGWQTEGTRK